MTEQKIEKIVLDRLQDALSAVAGDELQFIGAWQPADEGDIKSLEDGTKVGVVAVKALPRIYDTPTIPDGQIQVQISLTMRADVDSDGKTYLDVTDALQKVTHRWQKSYANYAEDFAISDEFQPTGFNIDSGDVGLDKENCVWTFSQSFTLYGIIET